MLRWRPEHMELLRTEQRALTKTFTVFPPTVMGVVVAAVPAVDDTLCFLPLVACPTRSCLPTFPWCEASPVAVASFGLILIDCALSRICQWASMPSCMACHHGISALLPALPDSPAADSYLGHISQVGCQ